MKDAQNTGDSVGSELRDHDLPVKVPEDLRTRYEHLLAVRGGKPTYQYFAASYNFEAKLIERIAALEAENAQWRTWGMIEIATRNPNVASYMEHWEGRATKAEQERDALQAQAERLAAPVSEAEIDACEVTVCDGRNRRDLLWRNDVDAIIAARAKR